MADTSWTGAPVFFPSVGGRSIGTQQTGMSVAGVSPSQQPSFAATGPACNGEQPTSALAKQVMAGPVRRTTVTTRTADITRCRSEVSETLWVFKVIKNYSSRRVDRQRGKSRVSFVVDAGPPWWKGSTSMLMMRLP